MNLFTLKQMASLIADREGRDETKVFNQLRGAHGRGLLTATDSAGPKGAHRFSRDEFCAGRLILALLDIGFTADRLTALNKFMRATKRQSFADGSEAEWGLEAAVVETTMGGPKWVLRILVQECGAAQSVIGALRPAGWAKESEPSFEPDFGCVVTADVIIPASDLWKPYVNATGD